jgi:hypothetical protein
VIFRDGGSGKWHRPDGRIWLRHVQCVRRLCRGLALRHVLRLSTTLSSIEIDSSGVINVYIQAYGQDAVPLPTPGMWERLGGLGADLSRAKH